ncbi:hypothetical protein NBRC116602_28850 [Hyphomicrobiales bacterium 4NK60-0047b]
MTVMLSLGVPNSGFQQIHDLVTSVGLGEAKKSRRENYTPNEITEKLCEKYNCLKPEYSGIEQLNPGKVWHSLASDMMLGNLDQKNWGWSDSNSIFLLEFWKGFEPELNFLLIYSSPQAYLAEYFINNNHEICEEVVTAALSSWKNYNSELLRFYLENRERCMLINLEAGLEKIADVMNKVGENLGCELKLTSTYYLSARSALSCEKQLIYGLISENLEMYNFYDELESCADFPMFENEGCHKKIYPTLNSLRKDRQAQKEVTEVLRTLKTKNLNLELELQKNKDELKSQREAYKSLADKLNNSKKTETLKAANGQKQSTNKFEKENELLLLQLHQVQEELETYFHKYQELALKECEGHPNDQGTPSLEKTAASIDMRHFIEGQNWYNAEHDGRWTGPDHISSLKIPQLPKGTYEIELNIVSAMSPKIIRQMKLLWNGDELPKKIIQPWAGMKALMRRYYLMIFQNREGGPLILKTKLEIDQGSNNTDQFLGLQLPCTISPSSRGQQDTRDLGIKLSEVKLSST